MEFDDEWINKYDNSKNRPRTLKVFFCYMDKENVLQKMHQEVIEVRNNILTKDEVIKLILRNKRKYQLFSILSYIVREVNDSTDYSSFFNEIKIENISFKGSDRVFESTNSLFFMFREFDKKLKANTTKKIRIHTSRNTRRKGLKATTTEL